MKNDYKFVIIVPNYNNDHGSINGKSFLANCIESILSQEYRNFILIIIDDCSTDTSVSTIEKYLDDSRVVLIKNRRKRYNGGSRNVGIEYALDNIDFDYFCFLDSDDWWKHGNVLQSINDHLDDKDLMLLGYEEVIDINNTHRNNRLNYANDYEDLYCISGKVLCSAWSRVIKKEKIVYFCEDTLMEDRVWAYRLADILDFHNVINLKQIVYCWNRTNFNSVSSGSNKLWNASAYCHIGHLEQFLTQIQHKEMIPLLEERLKLCKENVNSGIYGQF